MADTSRCASSLPMTNRSPPSGSSCCSPSADGVDLVGTASDGESAVRMAEALSPTCCCSTSPCPAWTGSTSPGRSPRTNPSPAVVFVTAFDQFAVAAFEVEAVDYLMKPVDPARLQRALDRARAYLAAPRRARPARAKDLAVARGILGVGPVRPGPDRGARRRPGVGRARLYAAARRPPQLADPPFDDGAGRRARSGAVRPAASLGDRPQGLHRRLHPQPVGPLDRAPARRRPSSRSAGSIRTGSGAIAGR